jgi:hypothetical protein
MRHLAFTSLLNMLSLSGSQTAATTPAAQTPAAQLLTGALK